MSAVTLGEWGIRTPCQKLPILRVDYVTAGRWFDYNVFSTNQGITVVSSAGTRERPVLVVTRLDHSEVPDRKAQPGDGALIAAVRAGHTDCFAEIVRRYQPALQRVAVSRLGRTDWAEDAVQETFLSAFRSLRTYDSRYSFRTWLWTILLNQCRRQYRQHREEQNDLGPGSLNETSFKLLKEVAGREASPAARLESAERKRLLEQLLAGLPETQADALRLRFFGGLKFQEIAAAMNCSLSAAKNRVRRGLATMSEFIAAGNPRPRGADTDPGNTNVNYDRPVT